MRLEVAESRRAGYFCDRDDDPRSCRAGPAALPVAKSPANSAELRRAGLGRPQLATLATARSKPSRNVQAMKLRELAVTCCLAPCEPTYEDYWWVPSGTALTVNMTRLSACERTLLERLLEWNRGQARYQGRGLDSFTVNLWATELRHPQPAPSPSRSSQAPAPRPARPSRSALPDDCIYRGGNCINLPSINVH